MIPLTPLPEPLKFDAQVRKKGELFLAQNPNPTSNEFKGKDYWKSIAKDLYTGFKGICSYTCLFIYTNPGVVDHFLPKTTHPTQAYEWSNYRLTFDRINQYKGRSEEVLDPFLIEDGWFTLQFPSCLVKPGENLRDELIDRIERTIKILKLNDDDGLVQSRCDIILDLIKGNINLEFVSKKYPFISHEIRRQGLEHNIGELFKPAPMY